MIRARVIPSLLLSNGGLVKGAQFKNHKYVGDPINAVKIFNDKEVDELVFLDISANSETTGPNFELLQDIASQAFMPFGYGGGITNTKQIERLFKLGVEKVILNTSAVTNQQIIKDASTIAGSQSVVVSIDTKKNLFGNYTTFVKSGKKSTKLDPAEFAKEVESLGAGEILLTAIQREGTGEGYDLEIIKRVSESVNIPVIANGGASKLEDLVKALDAGASAVSAGKMFTFHGKHDAVLITYPSYDSLTALFNS